MTVTTAELRPLLKRLKWGPALNPRVFMPCTGGVGNYRKKCDEVAEAGYEG